MFTLIMFLFTLLILIVVHEFGHFIVARGFGVKVLRFSFGFGKRLAYFTDRRGTEYSWSLLPLGGYVKMLNTKEGQVEPENLPYAFDKQTLLKRFLIVLAGPVFNFLLAWLCIFSIVLMGRPVIPPVIEKILPQSPASQAGLLPGDKILSLNGEPIQDWMELVKKVQSHPHRLIKLTWLRQNHNYTARIKPVVKDSKGFLGIVSRLPEGKPTSFIRPSFHEALYLSSSQTLYLMQKTGALFLQLFTGQLNLQHLNGPLGIAQAASTTAHQGLIQYLGFLALVSISLGMVNLLPIPLLDGGHLLFYLIEAVLKRPLSDKTQENALKIGMVILLFFMFVAVSNDIARWSA